MWTIAIFLVVILTIIGEAHAQSSGSGSCLGSINALTLRESQFVTDYTVTRTYVFCPGLVFNIGVLDFNNRLIGISGQEFIQLRPNLHLKCGDSGRRENNCVLAGGDVQVEATDFFGVTLNPTNVRFEGFTFTTTRRYNIWVTKPGDITFVNCAFRVSWKQCVSVDSPGSLWGPPVSLFAVSHDCLRHRTIRVPWLRFIWTTSIPLSQSISFE